MNYEPLNYKYIKHNNLIILESIFTLYGNLKQLFIVPPCHFLSFSNYRLNYSNILFYIHNWLSFGLLNKDRLILTYHFKELQNK